MGKRICGVVAAGVLLFLLISCNATSSLEPDKQETQVALYNVENKDAMILQNTAEQVSAAEEIAVVPVCMEKEKQPPEEYIIEEFPVLFQMPELPTGCEITAMTMVLNYYGYDVDKTTMAADYLPTVSASQYYGDDGRLYGGDLRKYFVGDPFTEGGYICGTEAILNAADAYLQEMGSSMRAVDKTGASPEELYELVSQDTPVVVWVTIGMSDRSTPQGWYTESGDYVDWSTNDHGAVMIGYSEDTVTIADPISGLVEYSRAQFESVFSSRSHQCVILEA